MARNVVAELLTIAHGSVGVGSDELLCCAATAVMTGVIGSRTREKNMMDDLLWKI